MATLTLRLAASVASVALAGCQVILGIDDPVAGDDAPIDAHGGDANPSDLLCDPACAPGQMCDWDPLVQDIRCRDVNSASVAALAPCTEPSDCGRDQTCWFGACRRHCEQDADCAAPEDHCHFQTAIGTICDSHCDYFATDSGGCGAGLECITGYWNADVADNGAFCTPEPYSDDRPAGTTCSGDIYSCTTGYECFASSSAEPYLCSRVCGEDGSNPCSAPQICYVGLYTHHGIKLGHCYDP